MCSFARVFITAEAVMVAPQDMAVPEPGVDVDDLVVSPNPFYGPAFWTAATFIDPAKCQCTQGW
jgi:hypothetical protein